MNIFSSWILSVKLRMLWCAIFMLYIRFILFTRWRYISVVDISVCVE